MEAQTPILVLVLVGLVAWNILNRRWFKQAADFYKAGDYHESAKVYSKILWLQRGNIDLYYRRAECRIKLNQMQAAISDYDKIIQLQHAYIPAYLSRGRAFALQRDFEKAFQDIDMVVRLDPENFQGFLGLALLYRDQNDPDHAIIEWGKAIALIERDMQRAKQGLPYSSDENQIKYLEKTLEWAYERRGDASLEKDDFEAALTDYNHCISFHDKTSKIYLNRAVTFHRKGDRQAALADYNRAAEIEPENASIFLYRGVAKMELSEFGDAIIDFNEAIKLDDQNWVAYNNRAEGYFALRQYDDAMTDLRKADEIEAGQKIVQAGLAVTLHAMGKADEAKELWQSLITKNSQYRDTDWVQEKLRWSDVLADEARKLIATLDPSE